MPIRRRNLRGNVLRKPTRLLIWKSLLAKAKQRAVKKGLPFDIDIGYVLALIPEDKVCPITLRIMTLPGLSGNRWDRMSIDKVIPALGYVKGNVRIISNRANTLKSNEIDADIFRRLADYIDSNKPT